MRRLLLSLLAVLLLPSLACSGPEPPPAPPSEPAQAPFHQLNPSPGLAPATEAASPPATAPASPGGPLAPESRTAGVSPESSSPGSSRTVLAATDSPVDPERIFLAAVEAMADVSSYRYHMEVDAVVEVDAGSTEMGGFEGMGLMGGVGTFLVVLDGYFVAPDRNSMTMSVELGPITYEIRSVSIGDDLYVLDPFTGMWSLDDGSGISDPATDPAALVRENFPGGLAYVGLEELESGPVHHLRGMIDAVGLGERDILLPGSAAEDVEVHYRVGLDDMLFRSVGMSFSLMEDGVPVDLELRMDFTDYGAELSVERPLTGPDLESARADCDDALRARLSGEDGTGDSAWVNGHIGWVREHVDGCGPAVWKRQAADRDPGAMPWGCFTESRDDAGSAILTVGGAPPPSRFLDEDGSPAGVTARDDAGNMLIYWELDPFRGGPSCWLYLANDSAWNDGR